MKATSRLAKVSFETTYSAGMYRLLDSLYDKIRHFSDSQSKRRPDIDLIADVTRHLRIASASVGLIPEILTTHVRKKIRADKH